MVVDRAAGQRRVEWNPAAVLVRSLFGATTGSAGTTGARAAGWCRSRRPGVDFLHSRASSPATGGVELEPASMPSFLTPRDLFHPSAERPATGLGGEERDPCRPSGDAPVGPPGDHPCIAAWPCSTTHWVMASARSRSHPARCCPCHEPSRGWRDRSAAVLCLSQWHVAASYRASASRAFDLPAGPLIAGLPDELPPKVPATSRRETPLLFHPAEDVVVAQPQRL